MDYITILAVTGAFGYILYRRHKKKPSVTVIEEKCEKAGNRKEADLLEVLEILVAKLEILISRQEGKRMELTEALEILSEYRETVTYLLTGHIDSYDASRVDEAIREVTSYLEE